MESDQGKLFIGGISWETTEEKLSEHFSSYGEVTQAAVMRDKLTGRPRGFGFVVFADPAVVDRALQDPHTLDGRTVRRHPPPLAPLETLGRIFATPRGIFASVVFRSAPTAELDEEFSPFCWYSCCLRSMSSGRSRGRSSRPPRLRTRAAGGTLVVEAAVPAVAMPVERGQRRSLWAGCPPL